MNVKLKFPDGSTKEVDLGQVPGPGWDVRWENKSYSVVSVELIAVEPLAAGGRLVARLPVSNEPRAVLSVIPIEDTAP